MGVEKDRAGTPLSSFYISAQSILYRGSTLPQMCSFDSLHHNVLVSLLISQSESSLQALCITSRRLRDAITAESFQVNRIRMGFAVTDVWIDDRDEDDDLSEEEDEDDLGTQGDDRCLRHFGGCIFLDGATAGRFQCTLIDRMQCYHGKFLSV